METPALQSLSMSRDEVAEWWDRVDGARSRRKVHEASWETLLKEYLPKVVGYDQPEAIKINAHFRNVHTKLPKLFFQVPDLILTPNGPLKDPVIDPMTGFPAINQTGQFVTAEDVAVIKQEVLRKKLGREPEGINAPRLIDELLFDVLAWSGVAGSKIGYRAVIQQVQQPVPDPMTGMPTMDPMTGQPAMQSVPVTLWEEWYWTRIGPKKLLLPDELKSTRVDQDSPWIGMEFALSEDEARRAFGITGEMQLASEDEGVFKHADSQAASRSKKLIRGVEIWLKASKYDPNVLNPLQIRQLVLLEGNRETPTLYRDDPDQSFDETGRITPDSRVGFPIHVLTIRDLADSCFPPADSAFTNSQAKHLNTHRQQSSKLRDANIGRFFFDEGAFSSEEIHTIRTSDVGSWHGVSAGRLREGVDKVVAQVTQANQSRDDYRLAAMIKDDMDETLGLPRSEAGMPETGEATATEVATSSSKAAERLEKERGRVLDFFLTGVKKFDALLQRYADDADYVQIVGQDGTRRLQAWNRHVIAGGYAYDAKPDSQLRIDAARDRAQLMAFYTQTIQDPLINRLPIVKKLAQYFGLDPNQLVMPVMMPTGAPTPGEEPSSGGGGGGGNGQKPTTGALENRPVPGAGTTQVQNRIQGR